MLIISDNRWVLLLFFGLSTIQVGLRAINIPECFRDVSGIYLRKFHGANDYAILFFFPLGGVLQVDSAAKLNASQYFSDQAGFYTCKKQLDKAVLSFHGQYFDESGNMSTGLSEAVVTCIWYCSDSGSASGLSNYFTYPSNKQTNGQKIVSATFYFQCPSQYDQCTGIQQELYYPLQYQSMPLRNAALSASPPTFTTSRLSGHPTIKSCHQTFSGLYSFTINITSPYQISTINPYILYSNAVLFGADANENNPQEPTENILGFWDCNSNGNLILHIILFGFTSPKRPESILISAQISLTCKNDQCNGPYLDHQYVLQLPVNGTFPSGPISTGSGTVNGRKLDYQYY
ncbi:unnamed protein product [Didymodactylos carnosus]|uniref:Uncharacterized protein n=1 Tax=Didymodactylos carnosus TaxID=1234261 RepID=A0A814TSI8_9BILA|nr:unnamed protein product [Didymodactylos carnosus]CAF3927499.1 unnamed protein product [Didymodactylos carnosus]